MTFPPELRAAVSDGAARRGVSEAEWLADAARMRIVADAELAFLAGRAAQGDRAAYERVLASVPSTTPDAGDER